jgi:hypothetical protein
LTTLKKLGSVSDEKKGFTTSLPDWNKKIVSRSFRSWSLFLTLTQRKNEKSVRAKFFQPTFVPKFGIKMSPNRIGSRINPQTFLGAEHSSLFCLNFSDEGKKFLQH